MKRVNSNWSKRVDAYLPPHIENRMLSIVTKTGKTKSAFVREAVLEKIKAEESKLGNTD
jgi:predicted DNA-binding protein